MSIPGREADTTLANSFLCVHSALWRGIGPALVLVMNPIIQYTAFEQLKNFLITRRTTKLRAAGGKGVAILSDWDFFVLGAISKLGRSIRIFEAERVLTLSLQSPPASPIPTCELMLASFPYSLSLISRHL